MRFISLMLVTVFVMGCGSDQRFDGTDAKAEKIINSLSKKEQQELTGAMMTITMSFGNAEDINKAINGKTPKEVVEYANNLGKSKE